MTTACRNLLNLFTTGILLAALLACSDPLYTSINSNKLALLMESDVPVFDIRRPEEWFQTGVIEDSKLATYVDAGDHVMPGFLEKFTATVKPDEPVIIICDTGSRSRTLARYLTEELGYTQIYNVRNGIAQWLREDRPVKSLN